MNRKPRRRICSAGILPAIFAACLDKQKRRQDAGATKSEAALVLVASGNTRQSFLIFFLLILKQRAIGRQEGQLLLNDLVRIFRQVVDDGLDSDADASGGLGGIQIAELEE